MQKIVLFIEPTDSAYETPFKIGHLFKNRFTIEDEATFEIVKIFELRKSLEQMGENEKDKKGMSLST